MSMTLKITKQGLRDLNHYGPRTKAAAPEAPLPTDPAPPAIAEAGSLPGEANVVGAEAPSGAPAEAVRRDGGGVS